jgi:hypothetical protein
MRLSLSSAVLLLAGCPGAKAPSTPACPTDRTAVIAAQEDVAKLAACTALSSVTIRTGASINLSGLRTLATITGDLAIGPTVGLDEVSLPELTEVGGTIKITSNGSLHGVFLPRLETAGRFEIESNSALTSIALPRLVTSRGSLVIAQNGSLELVDLSELTTVGKDLVIADNPVLTLIEAGKLTQVMDVRIEGNRALPPDQVDGVRAKTPPPE